MTGRSGITAGGAAVLRARNPSGRWRPGRQQLVNALSAHSEDRGDITETLGDLGVQQAVRDFATHGLSMVLCALGRPICTFHSCEQVADVARPLNRDPPAEGRFQVGRHRTQTQRRRLVVSVVPGQHPPIECCNMYRPDGGDREGHGATLPASVNTLLTVCRWRLYTALTDSHVILRVKPRHSSTACEVRFRGTVRGSRGISLVDVSRGRR